MLELGIFFQKQNKKEVLFIFHHFLWILGECNLGEYDLGECNLGEYDLGECNWGKCNWGECDLGECNWGDAIWENAIWAMQFGRMQFAPTVDCAMAFSSTTSPIMYILSTMRRGMKYKPDANRLNR